MSSRKKGRPALNQPPQSKQAGGGTPLLRLPRTSDILRELTSLTPTVTSCSRRILLYKVVKAEYQVYIQQINIEHYCLGGQSRQTEMEPDDGEDIQSIKLERHSLGGQSRQTEMEPDDGEDIQSIKLERHSLGEHH
ncbi:hypothetical protein J6590_089140 [Homalodisca vitripennis]|nr:hypothetical protein J6590_089140 [Homalodisca vitripennis]